jgi:RHS repeat-associated protein
MRTSLSELLLRTPRRRGHRLSCGQPDLRRTQPRRDLHRDRRLQPERQPHRRWRARWATTWRILGYDPLGRLATTTATTGGSSAVTNFLYDGDRLVGEYGASGAALRHYVHGAGVDEPLVWYEGAAETSPKSWLHADRQGSIIATSSASGAVTAYTFGPYGEPSSWGPMRFAYTGQIALPEAQLYHYKARVYDPMMGRFLQTDPKGYDAGDTNLYAYVGDDPEDGTDPSGTAETLASFVPGLGDIINIHDAARDPSLINIIAAAVGSVPEASGVAKIGKGAVKDISKAFSSEKSALVDMAKADKRTGMTREDLQAYKELNRELPDPFPSSKVKGPEAHPNSRLPSSQQLHGHVGPVDHIPIRPDRPPPPRMPKPPEGGG